MRKKNRTRIFVSLVSGLAFLFVFILSVQNPPQKERLLRSNTDTESAY